VTPRIQVILGSTREGRFGERAAAWAIDRLASREDLEAELVDLRDYPMPFFDPKPPPLAGLDERLDTAVTDLVWWAEALARARAAG
jgi:NAD(P)H-dependent FMN reductase